MLMEKLSLENYDEARELLMAHGSVKRALESVLLPG
jgi:hypothetical protein